MKNLIKKVLREFTELNDEADYKGLSFSEATHVITKILPRKVKYLGTNLEGNKFKSGSISVLNFLETCNMRDPQVKFDIIETNYKDPSYDESPIFYKIKVHSDIINKIMKAKKGIDLSDWL